MSAVTLLAAGTKADAGVGSVVDVSAHALLKLTATIKANLGKSPQLQLTIETAPAAVGPFREVYSEHFSANNWPRDSTTRVVITPDNVCRVRWDGHATANIDSANNMAEFDLTVTGVGIPDA